MHDHTVTNHSEDGDIVSGLSLSSKLSDPNGLLGAIGISYTSPALMLASRLTFSIDIGPALESAGPSEIDGKFVEAVRIDDIRISLIQSWSLSSLIDPLAMQEAPPQAFLLWSMSGSSDVVSKPTGSFASDRLLLLPDKSWFAEQTSFVDKATTIIVALR